MRTNKKIVIPVVVILLGASIITLAINLKIKPQIKLKPENLENKEFKYDTVLLKKFSRLLQSLDFNKTSFSYSGKFNVTDGRDSSGNVHNLPFLFCRDGKVFYSKVGSNEVLNDNGVNIYIENDNKKVVVSNEKYQINPALRDLDQLIQKASSEQYSLDKSTSGSLEKLSLLNEHHIACKELSVTYDTLSQKLNKVLLRYTDINDPLNKKKDRKVEIDVSKIEVNAHIGKYPGTKDVVKEVDGKLALRSEYAAYELITL